MVMVAAMVMVTVTGLRGLISDPAKGSWAYSSSSRAQAHR
jgi:hypothetical protein